MAMPPEQTPPAPPPGIGTVNHRQAALARRFPAWQARTLDQMLDAAAAEFPTRPYLITDTQTWTYGDIKAWSERLAAGLLAAGTRIAGERRADEACSALASLLCATGVFWLVQRGL